MKKLLLSILTVVFLFTGAGFASDIYPVLGALTGGGTGALDKIDGAGLSDGDGAIVVLDGLSYHYHLDASSGASEDSPYVVSPDANAGTKRWVLTTPVGPMSHVKANTPTNTQAIATTTETVLTFDVEEYDHLGEYVPATGIFTAVRAGTYIVAAQMHMDNVSWVTGKQIYLIVHKNDVETIRGPRIATWSTSTVRLAPFVNGTVTMAIGDTLKILIYHNYGSNVSTAAGTWANFLTIDRIM